MSQSNTITLTGDAAQAAAFLEWAIAHGVEVTAVAVGGCTVQLAPPRGAPAGPSAERTAKSIYEQFGGKPFAEVAESVDDDQEFQPVVGRT